jgi:serine protease AprX
MAVEIPRALIEYILLGRGDTRRYIQDSPILADVWAKYALRPSEPVDLLIMSHMDSTANQLAAEINSAIQRPAGAEHDPDIAAVQSLVAARLYFGEVLTILVPLTSWWQDPDSQEEFTAFESATSPKLTEMVRSVTQLLESWLVSPDTAAIENTRSPVERFVALCTLVSLVSLSAWHGAKTTNDVVDLFKSADLKELTKTVSELLQKMQVKNEPKVWQISLNRRTAPAIATSVPTVKADAARRLFEIDCCEITWAIVDTGIDADHPAFGDRIKGTYDFTNYRQIVNVNNDKPDIRKANLKRIAAARKTKLPKSADTALRRIAEIVGAGRPTPWDLVAELVELKQPQPPVSDHGTQVAGILGAHKTGDHSKAADGMCPAIGIYDFRVLTTGAIDKDEAQNTELVVIAALQFIRFMNEQAGRLSINGVNMSLSIPHNVRNHACGRTPICKESERLIDSGVVVVAAAGNRGCDEAGDHELFSAYVASSITDPGNADRVITVGSTHPYAPFSHGVSYFSSRGPTGDGRLKPDLVAPGQEIIAPMRGGKWGLCEGTSMAAPYVSGAAAMLMARYSELIGNPDRIKRILCDTATDLGRERSFQGHGLLDVLRALQSQ